MSHPKSDALRARAEKVLAGGPATLSKSWTRFPQGIAPSFLSHGLDAVVWDMDGRAYIDCIAALGPILLGHTNYAVAQAVRKQANRLASASLSTALEVEVAEMLTEMIPGANQVRIATNGKDVTEAAIKVARYVTGKKHAVYVGYHGGFGDYLITTDKSGGILPQLALYNHQAKWGDFEALDELLRHSYTPHPDYSDDLAAIILEVPPEPTSVTREQTAATLQLYKELARQHGALFILDEVVTGFRYGLSGAQGYYGIQADMACFSKGMANGYPCAAIMGHWELMKAFEGGKVFLSTTFGAACIGLAACKATLTVLRDTDALDRLMLHGDAVLRTLMEMLLSLPVHIRGNYARFVFDFEDVAGVATAAELRTLWQQEMLKHGVLVSVPYFPMTCYDDHVVQTILKAAAAACEAVHGVTSGQKAIGEALECPVVGDIFSQRYNPLGARA